MGYTVNDISDAELIGRAVRNCRPRRKSGKSPKWQAVSETFALGSLYSVQLCRRFGVDPDKQVSP